MEKLVGHGANVNAVTDDGFSVLHIAKLQRHKTCVTWLLDIGADRTCATHQRTLRNCLHVQHSALYSSCSGARYSNFKVSICYLIIKLGAKISFICK
jgi:ankyrin repeat protein